MLEAGRVAHSHAGRAYCRKDMLVHAALRSGFRAMVRGGRASFAPRPGGATPPILWADPPPNVPSSPSRQLAPRTDADFGSSICRKHPKPVT